MKIGKNNKVFSSRNVLLELESDTSGLLLNRMSTAQRIAISPGVQGRGMIVYDTTAANRGVWQWDGSKWVMLGVLGWELNGNTGTNSGSNFVGTTDSVSLRFRTNNKERMVIDSLGQVGIGTSTPNKNAVLELQSNNKAFLPTRIALLSTTDTVTIPSPIAGMMVYNTNTVSDIFPGFYYFDGARWNAFFDNRFRFFYSPSISIPITAVGTGFTVNLYDQYTANFSTPAVKSPSAPSAIPVFASSDLNYYISNFDPSILANITISDSGLMTYDVIATTPSFCSFVNVIFTLK